MANVEHEAVFFGPTYAGTAVTVKVAKTGANAVLSSDRNGTVALTNPVTVGAYGVLQFYAPAGRYLLQGSNQEQQVSLQGGTESDPVVLTKPTATGSRATYSATREQAILTALVNGGLIVDTTTA